MYLLDVHLPGSLLSVCLFESLRSLRFKAERRAERVWNTLSLSIRYAIYAIYAIADAERSGGYR